MTEDLFSYQNSVATKIHKLLPDVPAETIFDHCLSADRNRLNYLYALVKGEEVEILRAEVTNLIKQQ
jgi:hypothetical protein